MDECSRYLILDSWYILQLSQYILSSKLWEWSRWMIAYDAWFYVRFRVMSVYFVIKTLSFSTSMLQGILSALCYSGNSQSKIWAFSFRGCVLPWKRSRCISVWHMCKDLPTCSGNLRFVSFETQNQNQIFTISNQKNPPLISVDIPAC